jgi:hypothetical protein
VDFDPLPNPKRNEITRLAHRNLDADQGEGRGLLAIEEQMPPCDGRTGREALVEDRKAVNQHVVGIHGVGCPPLGSKLEEMVSGVRCDFEDRRGGDLSIGGCRYPYAELGKSSTPRVTLWEVNWSDLEPAPEGRFKLFAYFVRIIAAIVQLAATGWQPDRPGATGPSVFGVMFRRVYFSAMVWAFIIPTTLFFTSIVSNRIISSVIVIGIAVLTALAAHTLSRSDPLLRAGYFWAASVAVVGLVFALAPGESAEKSVSLARLLESVAILGMVLFPLAVIEITARWLANRKIALESIEILFVRISLFVLAIIALSGIGALIWAINFNVGWALERLNIADQDLVNNWKTMYYESSIYNVAFMELVNGGAAFLAGFYLIIGFLLWFLQTKLETFFGQLKSGAFLRDWIAWFFPLSLAFSVAVITALVVDLLNLWPIAEAFRLCDLPGFCASFGIDPTDSPASQIRAIYTLSALRLLPFLALLVGPMRTGLDIAADILLYIQPPRTSPLATGEKARIRLMQLYEHLAADPAARISVVAESQGTRIAVDALQHADVKPAVLVTVGSPLAVLYLRLLNVPVRVAGGGSPGLHWRSFYRWSDFIGGPIPVGPDTDEVIPTNYQDSHFRYWKEPEVISAFALRGGSLHEATVRESGQKAPVRVG